MSKPNCKITRNFAFGDKQYKKGSEAYLSGDAEAFALENNLATDWIAKPAVKKAPKKTTKSVTIQGII